jgi:p25-alpha
VFHKLTDERLYTGAYKHDKVTSPRGRSRSPQKREAVQSRPKSSPRRVSDAGDVTHHPEAVAYEITLHSVFQAFCAFGTGTGASMETDVMDNARFAKLAKECGLVSKDCNSTDIDIVFSKVKGLWDRGFGCSWECFLSCAGEDERVTQDQLCTVQTRPCDDWCVCADLGL